MSDEQTITGASMARTIKRARAALVEALAARPRTAGEPRMRAAHSQVFEHLGPDGARLTTLAERAQMTHQAMSELVGELIDNGYLERVADPADGRARLIRPTAQGRRELGRANDALRDIRQRWQAELDAVSVEQVLDALQVLIRVCDQYPRSSR